MTRKVTEDDFRMKEFVGAKIEDYEFRDDGKLVRKDRWYCAVIQIASIVGVSVRDFEIDDVVDSVRKLAGEE